MLSRKLAGHYNYFAISGNDHSVSWTIESTPSGASGCGGGVSERE
jgi:hypothetical protein